MELTSSELKQSDERAKGSDSKPRLLADVMLGSLARWLRILGYDTAYDNRIVDDDVVRLALRENRIVLTRDTRLCQRRALRDRHLLIESQRLEEQLSQVLAFLCRTVPAKLPLSRCVRCNGPLALSPRPDVRDEVPPYVWETQPEFKRCLDCGHVFWHGTHRQRMLEKLRRLRARQADRTPAKKEPHG